MSDYIILTDSCCDLDAKKAKELGIELISLSLEIDGKSYKDDPFNLLLPSHEFYDMLRNGKMGTTSQINRFDFSEKIKSLLQKGKDILYLGFSSALSGTYGSFMSAKKEIEDEGKYPGKKIIGIDTLCASLGQGLLLTYAVRNQKNDMSIEENASWVETHKLNLIHLFTIDDLNILKRGGRLSGSLALIGSMLKLKPLLRVDNEGRLVGTGKVFGRKNSLKKLVENISKNIINPNEQEIYISHGDCLEEVNYVQELIQELYHPKNIYVNQVGPVIGSHSGPGCIAIFYMGSER